jgi:RNA polymerase sigma factor (TIGR02999 family)
MPGCDRPREGLVTADSPEGVTALLKDWRRGNQGALERLIPLVQDRLRGLARGYLARERPGHLLQTTGLVNEAYIKLIQIDRVDWRDRAHFLAMAATVMRRILVEFARERAALKRGGSVQVVEFDERVHGVPPGIANDLVGLDEALERLAAMDERAARVVEMRFFAGLSVEESAEALAVSPNTVKRDWTVARLWLLRELSGGAGDGP